MRIILAFFNIALILYSGCNNNSGPTADVLFPKYINETFSLKIPDETHYFILVPKFGCKNCMKKDLDSLTRFIQGKQKDQYTLITSNPGIVPSILQSTMNFIVDSNEKMENINMGVINVTVFKTKNGKLKNRHSFNPKDTTKFCVVFDNM